MARWFIALLLLLGGYSHAGERHTYIFGDSLSSPTGCEWSKQLSSVVHNYAQRGLTLRAYDFPDHLRIQPEGQAVVYIGTNDAGSGVSVVQFTLDLRELVVRLQLRGARVYIVAQPYLDFFQDTLAKYRTATEAVAEEYGAAYLDPLWGSDATIDGIHLGCGPNAYLGGWIEGMLNE